MNIYTKLYIKEYTKTPYKNRFGYKRWYLNLSYNKYYYLHRNFDLPSKIWIYNNKTYKIFYYMYGNRHRLIGPCF